MVSYDTTSSGGVNRLEWSIRQKSGSQQRKSLPRERRKLSIEKGLRRSVCSKQLSLFSRFLLRDRQVDDGLGEVFVQGDVVVGVVLAGEGVEAELF